MSKEEAPNHAFVSMFETMLSLCRDKGWSQRRLCAALGMSESWLSKIKHAGRGMDLTVLIRICELTGIPPERLLAGYPCPKSSDPVMEKLVLALDKLSPEEIQKRVKGAFADLL